MKQPSWAPDAFWKFHRENPQAYAMFVTFAWQARSRRERFSATTILHRMRWAAEVEGMGDAHFKVNNNWSPYFARLLQAEEPDDFGEFFQTRELFSRAGKPIDPWPGSKWSDDE